MTLVLDASAVAAWLLADEDGSDLSDLIRSHDDLIAPLLFAFETRNILLVGERRGRLAPGFADRALSAVMDTGIALDASVPAADLMDLARRHALSAYDAAYLHLALSRGAVLATRDRVLAAAARAEGVAVA